MITWEPGGRTDGQGGIASSVTLAEIASGSQDAAVSRFLTQLKSFQGPVVIRFAHEMNGSWYSWAGDPTTFKTAWAHIHSKVAELAPNVKMAWSVNNVDVPSSNTLEAYWPGASQVDYVGLDGYNCLRGWESPSVVFGQVYSRIAALDPAVPIWITETGSCEATPAVANSGGESKAAWITSLLGSTSFPRVSALVWFDRNKEFDWRVNSSAAAAAALKSGLAP
jgi:beta-mannanase